MRLTNQNIWHAGIFNDKRQLVNVSGPKEVRWKKIIARVEAVLDSKDQLFVIVAATGSDPRSPNLHDVTNAKLAATVVAKQPQHRFSKKRITVLLRYQASVQVQIDVDTKLVARQVRNYLRNSRCVGSDTIMPAPLLAFLINQTKRMEPD